MDEKYAYKLLRDLFEHKDAIFGELKRQTHTQSGLLHHQTSQGREAARQRTVSNTDESDRRAKYEARMKAVTERVRDKSPAPGGMRHRRDKSEGRFPVVASPTANTHAVGVRNVTGNSVPMNRHSLDVPGSLDGSPVNAAGGLNPNMNMNSNTNGAIHVPVEPAPLNMSMPGAFMGGGPGPHIPPPAESEDEEEGKENGNGNGNGYGGLKRSSLGSGRKMAAQQRRGTGTGTGTGRKGVTLSDRAMD
jgi:hypothetical protein